VECLQCQEQFCARCAADMHKAGRMKEHFLKTLGAAVATASTAEDRRDVAPEPTPSSSAPSPRVDRRPAPGRCSKHPEESAQFFCMDCDDECVCAECAVDAAHRGREVMAVRKAYQTLSPHLDKTLEGLQARADDHTKMRREADALKTDLNAVIGTGKQNIQESFRKLRATIAQKETELLAGIDACETSTAQALASRMQPASTQATALQELQAVLRQIDPRGEEVKALNAFAAAKVAVEDLVEPHTGVSANALIQLLDDLRLELRGALDHQTANVASLGSFVKDIRQNGMAGPVAGTLGR